MTFLIFSLAFLKNDQVSRFLNYRAHRSRHNVGYFTFWRDLADDFQFNERYKLSVYIPSMCRSL